MGDARVRSLFSRTLHQLRNGHCVDASWRGLRHQWLYLNTLDTAAAVRRLVAFYLKEFNEAMPHSTLNGRTRRGVLREERGHPDQPGSREAGSTSETASREPGRHVREVHGDVGANDGPRERSLIEEGNPKTVEESTVTKYREGMSRMS